MARAHSAASNSGMACSRVRPLAAVVVNRSASKVADTDSPPVTGGAGEGPSSPVAPHSSLINPRLSMAGVRVRRCPLVFDKAVHVLRTFALIVHILRTTMPSTQGQEGSTAQATPKRE